MSTLKYAHLCTHVSSSLCPNENQAEAECRRLHCNILGSNFFRTPPDFVLNERKRNPITTTISLLIHWKTTLEFSLLRISLRSRTLRLFVSSTTPRSHKIFTHKSYEHLSSPHRTDFNSTSQVSKYTCSHLLFTPFSFCFYVSFLFSFFR